MSRKNKYIGGIIGADPLPSGSPRPGVSNLGSLGADNAFEAPSLDLNFDGQISSFRRATTSPTAPKVNGDQLATDIVSCTRSTTATFLGSNGLIQTAAVNTPRVEYDASGNPLGLLVEEARTNLLTKSADLTHSDWSAYNSVGVTGGQADPAGGTGAFLVEDKQTTFAHLRQDVSATAYSTYTASIFVKKTAAAASELLLRFKGLGETNADVRLDTYTGQIAGGSDIDVQDCNGWWRISTTTTLGSATQLLFVVYPAISASFNGGDAATAQTTAGTHIVYGPQVELGEGSTSYIPTDTTTLTRTADDITLATSAFGFDNANGTTMIDFTVDHKTNGAGHGDYPRVFEYSDGTNVNRVLIQLDEADTELQADYRVNLASNGFLVDSGYSYPLSLKVAMAHSGTTLNVAKDGAAVGTTTTLTATPSSLSTLRLGGSPWPTASAGVINGHIRRFMYFPRAISDASLAEYTSDNPPTIDIDKPTRRWGGITGRSLVDNNTLPTTGVLTLAEHYQTKL